MVWEKPLISEMVNGRSAVSLCDLPAGPEVVERQDRGDDGPRPPTAADEPDADRSERELQCVDEPTSGQEGVAAPGVEGDRT